MCHGRRRTAIACNRAGRVSAPPESRQERLGAMPFQDWAAAEDAPRFSKPISSGMTRWSTYCRTGRLDNRDVCVLHGCLLHWMRVSHSRCDPTKVRLCAHGPWWYFLSNRVFGTPLAARWTASINLNMYIYCKERKGKSLIGELLNRWKTQREFSSRKSLEYGDILDLECRSGLFTASAIFIHLIPYVIGIKFIFDKS